MIEMLIKTSARTIVNSVFVETGGKQKVEEIANIGLSTKEVEPLVEFQTE